MNRMAVTFVTGNKNKLAEVQAILADVLPNLKSQPLDRKSPSSFDDGKYVFVSSA